MIHFGLTVKKKNPKFTKNNPASVSLKKQISAGGQNRDDYGPFDPRREEKQIYGEKFATRFFAALKKRGCFIPASLPNLQSVGFFIEGEKVRLCLIETGLPGREIKIFPSKQDFVHWLSNQNTEDVQDPQLRALGAHILPISTIEMRHFIKSTQSN